jgi:hypothetical protein
LIDSWLFYSVFLGDGVPIGFRILVLLVAALIAVPWVPILFGETRLLQRQNARRIVSKVREYHFALYWIPLVVLIPMFWHWLVIQFPVLAPVGPILISLFFGAIFGTYLINLVVILEPLAVLRDAILRRRDMGRLKRAMRYLPRTRGEIAGHFLAFETADARGKYTYWLSSKVDELAEFMSDRTNTWPDGVRPNVNDDAGSIRLARLDERWWGLQ